MENKTMAIKTTIQLRRDTLANWLAKNPVLANGEIALVDKNNGVGEKNWVLRIGDGATEFKNLPETAYALSSDVQAQVDALSAEISGKVKIDDVAASYVNIKRVSAEAYHELVDKNGVDDQTIYIVSSDNLNAFGEKITNVGDATEDTDAVNLGQLKSVSADLDQKIADAIADATGNATEAVKSLSVEVTNKIDILSGEFDTFKGTTDDSIHVINETLGTLDGTLNEHGGRLTSLEDTVGVHQGRLELVETTVYIHDDRLSAVEDKTSVLESQVGTINETTIPGLDAKIATNSAAIETLSGEATTKISILSAKIVNLSGDVDTFKEETNGSIGGINGTLSSLDEKLGAAEGTISTHEGMLLEYGDKIGVLSGQIESEHNYIIDAKAELTQYLSVAVGAGQKDDAGEIKYTLTQGGVSIGDIVVPRDIFVETAVLGEDNKLILKLKDGTEIPVDLGKFIDTYTAKDSDTIDVTVENREISADVKDGSIVEAKLGDKAVTTAKIADEAVTATQIANDTITMAKLSSTDTFVFDCGGAA